MFDRARQCIHDRTQSMQIYGLKIAGLVGGGYVLRQYVSERLEEARERVVRERGARDGLLRRFTQTHTDATYTIMALLPTLFTQIAHARDMDVEGLTRQLRAMGSAKENGARAGRREDTSHSGQRQIPTTSLHTHTPSESESEPASVAASESASVAASESESMSESVSSLGVSWGEVSPALSSGVGFGFGAGSTGSASWQDGGLQVPIPNIQDVLEPAHTRDSSSSTGAHLSDSITTASSQMSYPESVGIAPISATALESGARSISSKAELWREVKITTLTRTLTTLYTSTLLALLTTLQLTLLARERYVCGVLEAEVAERNWGSEKAGSGSDENLGLGLTEAEWEDKFWGYWNPGWVDRASAWAGGLIGSALESPSDTADTHPNSIHENTELRYLTLSWWLLHVGWKDIAARVRAGVESVAGSMSLKAQLGPEDLHTLLCDVRRRVEYEYEYEYGYGRTAEEEGRGRTGGQKEKRISFLSSILPPTPETTAHALAQGGAPPPPPVSHPLPYSDTLSSYGPPAPPSDLPYSSAQSQPSNAQSRSHSHSRPHASPSLSSSSSSYAHALEEDSLRLPQHPTSAAHYPSRPPSTSHRQNANPDPDPALTHLLAQTRAYLRSPDFAHVLGAALDCATRGAVVSVCAGGVFGDVDVDDIRWGGEEGGEGRQDDAKPKVRLASVLPALAKWSQQALDGLPNELIEGVMATREVSALEAIVMTDYQDRFNGL